MAGPAPDRQTRILPEITLHNVSRWRHHRLPPLITGLPNFGLVFGAILWILLFLWTIVRPPVSHYGLAVGLRIDESTFEKSPWSETLGVYLGADGSYYVNGKRTTQGDLHATLKSELNRRMVWDVYLESSKDAHYSDAIYAIDVIQKLGA